MGWKNKYVGCRLLMEQETTTVYNAGLSTFINYNVNYNVNLMLKHYSHYGSNHMELFAIPDFGADIFLAPFFSIDKI
jgi:hypothetical protein